MTETGGLLSRLAGCLLAGASLLCSCSGEPSSLAENQEVRWYPVAWEDSTTIAAVRVRTSSVGNADAILVRCIDAGLFNISLGDTTYRQTRSFSDCALLRDTDWPSVRPGHRDVVLGAPNRIFGFAFIDSTGIVHYVHQQCKYVRTPSWSSDGQTVIFTGVCGEELQAFSIAVAGVVDSSHRQLTEVASIAPLSYARMNRDQSFVTFTRGHLGAGASVVVVDVGSGREVAVWPGMMSSWHPSLDVLAYLAFDNANVPLLGVRDLSGLNHSIVWRPAGTNIASSRPDFSRLPMGSPLWSSDGSLLAISLGERVAVIDVRSGRSLTLLPTVASDAEP